MIRLDKNNNIIDCVDLRSDCPEDNTETDYVDLRSDSTVNNGKWTV